MRGGLEGSAERSVNSAENDTQLFARILGAIALSAVVEFSAAGQMATVSAVAGQAGQAGYLDGTGSAARFNPPTGVAVATSSGAISFRPQLRMGAVEQLAACSGGSLGSPVFLLTSSSTSVLVGDSFVLGWCDPSYFQSGDNSFGVDSYSVYYSQDPNSGFQLFRSGIASTLVGWQIYTGPTDAGLTYYFFVRAIGSGETIAGPMPKQADSNVVSVSVTSAACSLSAPVATSNSPVCAGSPIRLQATFPQYYLVFAAATPTWKWNGPDGWSSTDQNPTISVATTDSAGTYRAYYSTDGGTCWSLPGSATVAVKNVVLSPTILPNGTVGTSYSQVLSATGGTSPYTFSYTGTLPTGLSLTSTGVLSGTPTAEGSFNSSIAATDSTGCVRSQQYTILISSTCTIRCTASVSPSPGTVGQSLFFNSSATPSNCFGSVGYAWNFGDGGPGSSSSSSTHSYSTLGTYYWSLTASIGTTQCVKTGSVTITDANQMLTVTNASNGGTGTVKSTDGFVNCGSICSYSYTYNTLVTLTATPTSPSTFTAWSGACTGGATTCQVAMNQPQAVTATFGPPSCTPGNPVNLTILPKNGLPGAPPTGTDTLVLGWQPGAGTTPTGYSYWLNGDTPSTTITATSVETGPRKSAGTVTLNVKASACTSVLWSGTATLGPVSLGAPVARFSMSPTGVLGVPVTLTDQSSPQGTSWLWIYADGNPADTSHLQSHVFTASGPQEVALIVSNGSGTSMAKNTINVSGSIVTPPAAENVRKFDASGEGRLALAAASIGYGHRSWLQVASQSTETATVYLRFLAEDGGLALERRLELGPLSDGKCDLGAYGLKGKFRLEVASDQPVAAWLLEERVVEEPRAVKR